MRKVASRRCLAKHVARTLASVRIDDEELDAEFLEGEDPVAQLRNLAMTDRSRIAMDEDQDDSTTAEHIRQPHAVAVVVLEVQGRRRLPDDGRIETVRLEIHKKLPAGTPGGFSLTLENEADMRTDIAVRVRVSPSVEQRP